MESAILKPWHIRDHKMSDTAVPRQPHAFSLWREAQDTRVRTRLGGVFYLLAWLLVWGFAQAPQQDMLLGLGGTLLFASLWGLRLAHALPTEQSSKALQRWLDRHWALILSTALAWGLVYAMSLSQMRFSSSANIATLSTIAFSTAMAFNFAMRKYRAITALVLLYLPGLLTLLWHYQEQLATLVTLACYFAYLLLALNRSHREYRATLELELQLLEQQARLEQINRTDSLTQLGNRYLFNNLFPAMLANAQRSGEALSLVLLDIDFFKQINDQYGHISGDTCLAAFAERMRLNFRRDSDALLRLGGEEFGVLLPNTSLEQARLMAEDFRQQLAGEGFQLEGHLLPLTASLGVGCFDPARDHSAEGFFRRVDNALYAAKAAGRNRVVTA